MMKGRIAAVLAGAMLFTGVAAGIATAGEDGHSTASSSIDMVYKGRKDKFVGTVGSGNGHCVGSRTVKLFKARTGVKVGSTKTNADGRWAIPAKDDSGKYYAKVTSATFVVDSGSDQYGNLWEHLLTCGGARTVAKAT